MRTTKIIRWEGMWSGLWENNKDLRCGSGQENNGSPGITPPASQRWCLVLHKGILISGILHAHIYLHFVLSMACLPAYGPQPLSWYLTHHMNTRINAAVMTSIYIFFFFLLHKYISIYFLWIYHRLCAFSVNQRTQTRGSVNGSMELDTWPIPDVNSE